MENDKYPFEWVLQLMVAKAVSEARYSPCLKTNPNVVTPIDETCCSLAHSKRAREPTRGF